MNQERFDDVAKGLASGTVSRGQALRWMGGALVGAALASVPRVAWAANGGNSACAHFCTQTFPPGPQRAECISAAARGEGLCFECGPKATDTTRVLCGQVCCVSGETCSANGQCVPSNICTEANSSPGGGMQCGTSPSGTSEAGQRCFCRPLVEGGGACTTNALSFCKACNSNADCPSDAPGRAVCVSIDPPPPGFAGICASTCEAGSPGAACICPDLRPACNRVCCPPGQCGDNLTGSCQPDV
jgi:hypothetical protein